MSVLERHAMEEATVKMVSMTTLANAIQVIPAKTAKQVSNYSSPAICHSFMLPHVQPHYIE